MAGSQHIAAPVFFGIAHTQKMSGIDRNEKFEVNLLGGEFVGELSEKPLKFTAGRIIRNAKRITKSLKDSTAFFMRSVGMRGKLLDSVNVVVKAIVWTREEANSASNQGNFIAIGIQFGRLKD